MILYIARFPILHPACFSFLLIFIIPILLFIIMGNDFCNSCNAYIEQESMRSTNSTYGAYYSQPRGYSVNQQAKSMVSQKPKGLQNLTNTCYISAILQILFMILPSSINKGKDRITDMLFRLKQSKDTKTYKELKNRLEKCISIVQGYQQQDAQQFLTYLLQILDRENSELSKKIVPNLDYKQNMDLSQNYKIFMNEMKKIESSPVVDLFSGEFIRQFKCSVREHTKYKFERFQSLSLSFPEQKLSSNSYSYPYSNKYSSSTNSTTTVKQMIKKQLGNEEIQDLTCERCKKKTNFNKRTFIWRLPNFLVLHLSRFKKGYYSNEKINAEVQFDEQMYLDQQLEPNKVKYRLLGVVSHFGSLNRGHYYVELKHTDGNWYQINDQLVRSTRIQAMSNTSKYVYILFYQKIK